VRKISKAKEPELKRMNLNVPIELHNTFKAVTASQGLNMTDVLMAYIKEYVEKHLSPKQKGRRK
jgi:ParG